MVSHWIRPPFSGAPRSSFSILFIRVCVPARVWLRACVCRVFQGAPLPANSFAKGKSLFRRCPIPSCFRAAWFPAKTAPLFRVKLICFWHETNWTGIFLQGELVEELPEGPRINNSPSNKRIRCYGPRLLFDLKSGWILYYPWRIIGVSHCSSVVTWIIYDTLIYRLAYSYVTKYYDSK